MTKLLDTTESMEFIQMLHRVGFDVSDWDYLQDLLERQDLSVEELQNKGELEETLIEIIEKFEIT